MQILPLKFIREEDKKIVGLNLFNLAKLGHLGLPVVESVVAVPPTPLFERVLNKYLKHNLNIHDHLNNLKTEILNLAIPESLKDFELSPSDKNQFSINTQKLWQNLLDKWSSEIYSRIQRGERDLLKLTPQLIIFSANFSTMGRAYFDEDRLHAVIKTDKGTLDFRSSSAIENLIIVGNKKILIPQVFFWGIEDEKIKIIKVIPFTQSLHEDPEEKQKFVSIHKTETTRKTTTATKIFLDFNNDILTTLNSDGVLLNIRKMDTDLISEQLIKIQKFDIKPKIIFFPDFSVKFEDNLKYAKEFLFFKNKKLLDVSIVLPETFSVNEFLNLKREYASLGIYSKGNLKIWKQFNTVADFLNLDEYLDAGFDGALIDLDKISKIVCGIEGKDALDIDQIEAIEKFFKNLGLMKIIKNSKPVLLKGQLAKNEELLNFFIKSGVWGICFENGSTGPMKDHISFLEKQALKKLSPVKIQH